MRGKLAWLQEKRGQRCSQLCKEVPRVAGGVNGDEGAVKEEAKQVVVRGKDPEKR